MINSPVPSSDFRIALPESIWLEPENFEQAKNFASKFTHAEPHQYWQAYLNSLALIGFQQWLEQRTSQKAIETDTVYIDTVARLNVDGFKLSVLATENLLDELVYLPEKIIKTPELATHFYVIAEVLEEQEEVIIRGFLRYDELRDRCSRLNLNRLDNGCYEIPLEVFNPEINHLVFYCDLIQPEAITLPVVDAKPKEDVLSSLKDKTTKLSQWLTGIFEETWQSIDQLINPQDYLAFSTRNIVQGTRRGKLIDLGMQLAGQTVALLVNITEESEGILWVLIQLHPAGGARYLPPNMKLTLFSKAGKIRQEVQARLQDNYIQLKPFKAEVGKRFSLEVSLEDAKVKEDFEL